MQRPGEQTTQQPPFIQRRSLPVNQQSRIPPQQRQATTYDTEDDAAISPQRPPSSAIRYTDTKGNQVIQQGKKKIVIHTEPVPRKIHWSLVFGIGMIAMLLLTIAGIWVSNWWNNQQLDSTYGMPRTYQVDAVVGHNNDSAANPSHFIFLNLNGHVEIIELPAGDASKAKIYIGPTLFTDNAALVPITGEFKTVNGTVEMLVHIQDQTIIYVSDGTMFKPKQ